MLFTACATCNVISPVIYVSYLYISTFLSLCAVSNIVVVIIIVIYCYYLVMQRRVNLSLGETTIIPVPQQLCVCLYSQHINVFCAVCIGTQYGWCGSAKPPGSGGPLLNLRLNSPNTKL
jgi:hypothetical protein